MTPERPPLRVSMSMPTLVPGGMGGSETYARELIRALARSGAVEVRTLVSAAAAGFTEGVPERVLAGVTGGGSAIARLRTLVEAGVLHRRAIRRIQASADVVHVPFTVAVPAPPRGVPLVQTLHDVQHLDLPHLFTRTELAYRKYFYERTAHRAAVVVTVSEFAKERIVHHLGLDPDRVIVAHLGVDLSSVTANFGERENFLLYPARGWPHKNHARLIEAVALLRVSDPTLRLVLTGGALDSLGPVPEWVDVRGLVPAAELQRLYRTARALVFPSLYEGFGLPPLEAMAAGCPVAASRAGSLPEICGDAAVLFDPHDPADLARAVVETATRASELQQRGIARLTAFSWDRCAAIHENAYRRAATR
ncbi:glycosyltransferase family 4 protein [Pengzhenrongella phosphoraccumulans]|uniref:glycosyltransferase family 4 protein n=1 Tax=Pengzhenrongella phosphoraccumulans TaxID=3114394 RepID=UPI003890A6D8